MVGLISYFWPKSSQTFLQIFYWIVHQVSYYLPMRIIVFTVSQFHWASVLNYHSIL